MSIASKKVWINTVIHPIGTWAVLDKEISYAHKEILKAFVVRFEWRLSHLVLW